MRVYASRLLNLAIYGPKWNSVVFHVLDLSIMCGDTFEVEVIGMRGVSFMMRGGPGGEDVSTIMGRYP